eukprot:TRINITY_DN67960_c0_g1_i1.p1 TRINITY_DN67960_c0_g1~~TRINITY_DN67960_c0_g1_i1.p1  ORF type:complete len:422 (-),score=7.93 TRINITY_DN67960_c0_g1_i1:158-1282(-)
MSEASVKSAITARASVTVTARQSSSATRVVAPASPTSKRPQLRVQQPTQEQVGSGGGELHHSEHGKLPFVFSSFLLANGLASEERASQSHAESERICVGSPQYASSNILPFCSVSLDEDCNEQSGAAPLAIASVDQQKASTHLQTNLQKQESELRDDYYVNVGYAIRTLREELPTMFYREMTYDIYRDDITFQDPMNTFRGMKNYRLIYKALRFHGKIFFKALWLDVQRVWQPNERTIQIRWSVRGIPRLPWESQGRFDGTSEYKLDSSGKIYAHKVDNIVMSDPPKYQPLTVMELLRMSGANTTPSITCSSRSFPSVPPAFSLSNNFLAEAAVVLTILSRFTWVRFYCALSGTLALKNRTDDGSDESLAPSSS